MIKKTIKVVDLHSKQNSDAAYWKSRPAEERINAVEFLRKQLYGPNTARLQIVLTVTKGKGSEY